MAKTSGFSISITKEEREKIKRLCDAEGRNGRAQIMYMVEKRLAEIESEDRGENAEGS